MTDMTYNIVVLGSGGTGKSALTIQMISPGHFLEEYDPTIEDSYRRQVRIDEQPAYLDILDTAGQDEYSAMRDQYLRSGEGYLYVYDVTSTGTLDEAKAIHAQTLRAKDVDTVPSVLVGNKCDLVDQRAVSTAVGEETAKTMGAAFIETSAKERINIDEAFFAIVRAIRKARKAASTDSTGKKKRKKCRVL